MTIKSVLDTLSHCEDLHDFQIAEIHAYVKTHHRGFSGIVNVMLKKYASATKPERVKLVASLKQYFPVS